jgi:hypothetical protein
VGMYDQVVFLVFHPAELEVDIGEPAFHFHGYRPVELI